MNWMYLSAFTAVSIAGSIHAQDNTATRSNPNSYSSTIQAFNPAMSAIVDMFYYHENAAEGMNHLKEELPGFSGHAHGEDEHGHESGYENGFNLRHLELSFSAEVDSSFKALVIAAIEEEGAEIDEAWVQTTGLPWGLQAKAGKFFSGFGYINAQHSHQWDFTDQPLIYELAFGDHGLNEKGIQVSWLAPTPVYLLIGAEVFQGENENMFSQAESDGGELPINDGPRLGVGWIKLAPLQLDNHALQLGLFGSSGSHQEIHEEPTETNYYDGINWFAGVDAVYKFDSNKPYGQGDTVLQAEYFYRSKELDRQSAPGKLTSVQDGYYIQGLYGFMPRLRGGLRWEQIGLTNTEQEPGEPQEKYGDSWRATAMLDFRPSEFSQIRFQVNNGEYDLGGTEGRQQVLEAFVQLSISLGAHGAHAF